MHTRAQHPPRIQLSTVFTGIYKTNIVQFQSAHISQNHETDAAVFPKTFHFIAIHYNMI